MPWGFIGYYQILTTSDTQKEVDSSKAIND